MKRNSLLFISNPLFIGSFLSVVLLFIVLYPYMSYDEGLWNYIGGVWARNGLPPYVESIENKTPGIFILFAISEIVSNGSLLFIRVLGVISLLVSSFFIFKIVKQLYNEFTGIIAMCIFGFVCCWFVLDGYSTAQTETFMVLFSVFAFYNLIKAKYSSNFRLLMFFSGLFLGLAISFKQIALTTFIAFVLFYFIYLIPQKTIKLKLIGLILFIFGVLSIITLLCLILYGFFGISVLDYIDGAWLILLNSGSKAPNTEMRISQFIRVFIFSKFIIFYVFLFFFIYKFKFISNPFIKGLVLWLIIDFFGVNASGYYFGHQIKQLIAPLSIIVAITISFIFDNYLRSITDKRMLLGLIIFLFFPYHQVLITGVELLNGKPIIYKEIGNWIENNTLKDDYVYLLGADDNMIKALADSKRVSSSRYFSSIFIAGDKENKEVLKSLKINSPVFILKEATPSLDIQNYNRDIIDFVENNYTLAKEIDRYQILKRKWNSKMHLN